ncbi:MAG: type VII toxin-antitoxin system MntA family adenylyltransferase antitoxin [Pseudobdellovibrionaceae bacterium]
MQDHKLKITEILSPYAEFVFLVGSYDTPRFNNESDVDLAVYFIESVDYQLKINLILKLEDLTGRDVELIDLRNIDPIFARQVIETGRLLVDNNHKKLVNWQITQLSKYLDFKMDRAVIEKNLLVRKRND